MTSLLFLTAWSGSGLAAAKVMTPGRSFDSWGPVAIILGPLFAAVADDKRSVADVPVQSSWNPDEHSEIVWPETTRRSTHLLTRCTEKPELR